MFRDFTLADLEAVHAYAGDPEVVRYMEWGPNTEEETQGFLARCITAAGENPRTEYELAVVERKTGILVGGVRLSLKSADAMLGYCFARTSWGRGYATEAGTVLVARAFSEPQISRVWASCDAENEASIRVLRKLGMSEERHLRAERSIKGHLRGIRVFAVLRSR